MTEPLRGPRLFVDEDMAEAVVLELAGGVVAVFCSRKPERDGPNEDAAVLIPVGDGEAVAAVADGAGGMPLGARAAELAATALRDAVCAAAKNGASTREGILDGFEAANRAVQDLGVGAATTLAAVEVQSEYVRSYHAGDSAVVVTGQRGKVKHVTVSHSPVGYAVEAGLLEEQEALHHDELHVVTNMLGSADMRIEIGPLLPLSRHDTVVLATDGLFDNLRSDEIVDVVRAGEVDGAAAELAAKGTKRMVNPDEGQPSKPDDMTFVLWRPGG